MKKVILIMAAIIGSLVVFSYMTELLRQPNDRAVGVGVVLACVLIIGNIFVIKQLIKK